MTTTKLPETVDEIRELLVKHGWEAKCTAADYYTWGTNYTFCLPAIYEFRKRCCAEVEFSIPGPIIGCPDKIRRLVEASTPEPEFVTGWEGVAKAAARLAEGKKVEYQYDSNGKWYNVDADDSLYSGWLYRLKPEPKKPREWDVFVSEAGLLFDCRVPGTSPREIIRVREVPKDKP